MGNIKFNVLLYDGFKESKIEYDVLPYFRRVWKDKKFNFNRKDVNSRSDLKNWIKKTSMYQFWARCEYEFLMTPWPLYSKPIIEELQKTDINIDNGIKISNVITKNMYKIDVHEQIMMNIDIVVDILAKEFKICDA